MAGIAEAIAGIIEGGADVASVVASIVQASQARDDLDRAQAEARAMGLRDEKLARQRLDIERDVLGLQQEKFEEEKKINRRNRVRLAAQNIQNAALRDKQFRGMIQQLAFVRR